MINYYENSYNLQLTFRADKKHSKKKNPKLDLMVVHYSAIALYRNTDKNIFVIIVTNKLTPPLKYKLQPVQNMSR